MEKCTLHSLNKNRLPTTSREFKVHFCRLSSPIWTEYEIDLKFTRWRCLIFKLWMFVCCTSFHDNSIGLDCDVSNGSTIDSGWFYVFESIGCRWWFDLKSSHPNRNIMYIWRVCAKCNYICTTKCPSRCNSIWGLFSPFWSV